MAENQDNAEEKRRDRRFQLELAKLQSADSSRSNMGLGLYVLGATFILGAFSLTDLISKISCLAAGVLFAGVGIYMFRIWNVSRDKKIAELERDYL